MVAHDPASSHPLGFPVAPRRNRRLGLPLRVLTKTVCPDDRLIEFSDAKLRKKHFGDQSHDVGQLTVA